MRESLNARESANELKLNGKSIDHSEFAVGSKPSFVCSRSGRAFLQYAAHSFTSVALSLHTKAKRVTEMTGTSIAMIEEHYGRYIADALLQDYICQRDKAGPKVGPKLQNQPNYREDLASPTGFEPVLSA